MVPEFYMDESINCEVHPVGTYLSVCRRTREATEEVLVRGKLVKVPVREVDPSRSPYLSFHATREIDGEECLDEDISVAGGMSIAEIDTLIEELQQAKEFMQKLM